MASVKNLKRMEAKQLVLSLLVGFFIGVLTCAVVISVCSAKDQLSLIYGDWVNPAGEGKNASLVSDAGGGQAEERLSAATNGVVAINQNSSLTNDNVVTPPLEAPKAADQHGVQSKTSSPTDHSIRKEETTTPKQPGGKDKANEAPGKPICDLSNWRTDVCEMFGDIRINAKSSSVVLVSDHQRHKRQGKDSWQIKPYARKFDKSAMQHIKEVSVRLSNGPGDTPRCTVANQSVPALVFAIGGYTGNYYHDFTDLLIPLFITARQFNGEVQFLISTRSFWWIDKYGSILKKLSRHEIVYFDTDEQVRCHRHVIVGLHSHKPMSIDPARAPNGYSMVDFTKFMRTAYDLERDSPIRLGKAGGEKPRLLLIPRKGTRRFTNSGDVVKMAEEAGFEVVMAEAGVSSSVAKFARVVNSCDVMLGVHGAGLTNFVFLPTNAVIIQIIPYGNLEKISRDCFKYSSEDAGLRYLDYCIGVEESSLIERYPRDDPVFKDPRSIHRLGWKKMGAVYLDNQDVKLDVDRFKPILWKAREILQLGK
ncbi:hypothetical protein Cni_G06477 [Canna indica]|uniref:Glycosyltransferase 61 catalytic domain-containing protein n=1 Tax=Canna indica TaxID=4628 RepID=A0AAQ3JYR9_9LILI|nr:hypothetical protein Cni_G06477 [Canna indica]